MGEADRGVTALWGQSFGLGKMTEVLGLDGGDGRSKNVNVFSYH